MKGRSHRLQTHDLHEDWGDGSWTVDCVCGVNFDDGEEMVNCDECGVWVHTRCSRYVKGDESFACDKCKSKNNRNDSEETEVAQFLVELPTKTIRLESSYAANGGNGGRPFRLWTDIPMEERVHVQGIPGGDPALFSGLSKVFTPELWKCTGYVPKKLNFQYREFPCWDEVEEEGKGGGRNDEENENTVDKGAGVLFSLSKDSVLETSVAALVGMRGRDEEGVCERKVCLEEVKKWDAEDREVGCSQIGVTKERNLIRPVVVHSGKRKKEDLGTAKDQSGKKKARTADKEADLKKRSLHTLKSVFTSTSDAKPLEFYEDRGLKPFKNDSQIAKNKNLRDVVIQECESDCYIALGNGVEKPKNNLAIGERSSEALPSDMSQPKFSTGAGLKEGKSSHEVIAVVESSPKVDNAVSSALEHRSGTRMPVKQEGDSLSNGHLDDNVEGLARIDVKPTVDELARTAPEVDGNQKNGDGDVFPSSVQLNVKVEVDGNDSRGALNCESSIPDIKDTGISNDNISENSKMNEAAISSSTISEHMVQGVDKTLEAVGSCPPDKDIESTGDLCLHKRGLEGSEAVVAMQEAPSDAKCGTELDEQSKSDRTILNSTALPSEHKMVGKSLFTSSNIMISKSSISDNLRSSDTLNPNPNITQKVVPESNSSIEKDQAASDAVRDEGRHDISRKSVKEHPKSSVNCAAPKASNSSKISHASLPKRTVSDSKDSLLCSSSKASLAEKSCENDVLMQNECASYAQNKAPASCLPVRSEKFNQSNSQSSSKSNQTSSMNPTVPANSPAALSDEELALLLHQELNSSPRVPRVPRVRHAGSLPQLTSPTGTSMLMKRTSISGGKEHGLVPRRKNRDASKDGYRRYRDLDDDTKKNDRVQSSPDWRRKDKGYTADSLSKREENGSPTALHSVKMNAPPASTSTANSGPSSSTEVNDHHLSSVRNSPGNISDEETGTVRAPVHCTLPGLINEIMSKGRRMTYEELCNAVLPHWHNLRKHNGERYAYSSPSQAVLDCLRNRHEWARLVDRGPKTNSSRKRRRVDADESEDNDYGKGKTAKEGESKSLESQREEFPKGKRKARRRRLALQGRGIKDVRKRQDLLIDEDSGRFSNSSEETLFSEDEIQGSGVGPIGSEAASASSDRSGSM